MKITIESGGEKREYIIPHSEVIYSLDIISNGITVYQFIKEVGDITHIPNVTGFYIKGDS